jgi:hypothetical protein
MISADDLPGWGICAVCKCEGTIHVSKGQDVEVLPGLFQHSGYHYWFCDKHYNEFVGVKS